jgi:hypothetical protein
MTIDALKEILRKLAAEPDREAPAAYSTKYEIAGFAEPRVGFQWAALIPTVNTNRLGRRGGSAKFIRAICAGERAAGHLAYVGVVTECSAGLMLITREGLAWEALVARRKSMAVQLYTAYKHNNRAKEQAERRAPQSVFRSYTASPCSGPVSRADRLAAAPDVDV